MAEPRSNLDRLFAPRSVAVVGASEAAEKAGHQALLALRTFPGEVFPINPKADRILERKAFPSLRAVGRPVDLVLFAIPAAACAEAVKEAIDCGCGGGLVLSGGFAEAGARGAALQADLRELCARSTFRILGPNTAGFVNKPESLTASFVAGASRLPSGPVAVVAQSAGINLTVSFLLEKLGSGVSMAVGLGNALDVGAATALEYLADLPTTTAIALHLEGIDHGRQLYEALKRVTPKKPVAVLTVGRADVGAFAVSHTGNLLGSYALRVNALKQAGAVVVESTEELASAAALLAQHRLAPKARAGVGILTAQAGPGLLMLDRLKASGVCIPALAASTLARIREKLPPMTYLENPVDTGRPGPSFGEVLAVLADDSEVDAVIAYALSEPAALRPEVVLPGVARRAGKPVLFGTVGPREETAGTIAELRKGGVYVAESPDELARAALVLARDAALRARVVGCGEPVLPATHDFDPSVARDEHAAKQLLERIGIGAPQRVACASHDEARAAFARLHKPVIVKILAAEIAHKTEVGGVHPNVVDERSLDAALRALDTIVVASERRYLVEEMAPPGLELIVGAVRDESFGPTLMVGAGGVFAEAARDTATRLAPLGLLEADEMLDELRVAPLLAGWRGSGALDRAAVARAIANLGGLLVACPEIREIEINPLRVYENGVLALDALVR